MPLPVRFSRDTAHLEDTVHQTSGDISQFIVCGILPPLAKPAWQKS